MKRVILLFGFFVFALTLMHPYFTYLFFADVAQAVWRDNSILVIFIGVGLVWQLVKLRLYR